MALVPTTGEPVYAREATPRLHLEPWSAGDLPLLRSLNAPEMTVHLGGPESEQKLLERQKKYIVRGPAGTGGMFTVVLLDEQRAVGSIGYWERMSDGETAYETGWAVLPRFQGRGIAAEATLAVFKLAAGERRHPYVHAYPSVDNQASNATCRRAGFELLGEHDLEYPPGHRMPCNNWRFDLRATIRT